MTSLYNYLMDNDVDNFSIYGESSSLNLLDMIQDNDPFLNTKVNVRDDRAYIVIGNTEKLIVVED